MGLPTFDDIPDIEQVQPISNAFLVYNVSDSFQTCTNDSFLPNYAVIDSAYHEAIASERWLSVYLDHVARNGFPVSLSKSLFLKKNLVSPIIVFS